MDIFGIRTLADVRAFLYVLLPVVTTLLVSYGALTDDKANLWAALVTAVLGPVVAAFNARSVSAVRTAFYAVFGAVQAIAIGYGLAQPVVFDRWMPLVVAIVGLGTGGVAAANTNTSPQP